MILYHSPVWGVFSLFLHDWRDDSRQWWAVYELVVSPQFTVNSPRPFMAAVAAASVPMRFWFTLKDSFGRKILHFLHFHSAISVCLVQFQRMARLEMLRQWALAVLLQCLLQKVVFGHKCFSQRLMMFNKLGRRKNPHPNPPPQAMEGTNTRTDNPYLIVKKHKPLPE
jgi:hypothetical protein